MLAVGHAWPQIIACECADETKRRADEAEFLRRDDILKRMPPTTPPREQEGFTIMNNVAKYLAVRGAAFIGLTAATTALLALPYLA
jgi:hypothetical protein